MSSRFGPRSRRLQLLGLCQIFCGAVVVMTSLACILDACWAHFLAVGIWCGAFYCFTGLVTVVGARLSSARVALVSMLLGLVSVTLTLLGAAMESVGMLGELHLRWFVSTQMQFIKYDQHLTNRVAGLDRRLTLHLTSLVCHSVHCVATAVQAVFTFQRYNLFQNLSHTKDYDAVTNTHQHNDLDITSPECVPLNPMQPYQHLQSVEEDFFHVEDPLNSSLVVSNPAVTEQQSQVYKMQPPLTPIHVYTRQLSTGSANSVPNSPMANSMGRRAPAFPSPMRSISQQQTDPLLQSEQV